MATIINSPSKLPGLIDSRHLFTLLFGTETICRTRKEHIPAEETAVVASYRDNEGTIRRLVVCDLALANSAGAALSAIPPTGTNNSTKAGKLAENVIENLSEVMNIAVNMMIESFGSRLELASVEHLSQLHPNTLAALSSEQRSKFDVIIPKYEPGRLDIMAVEIKSQANEA